MSAALFALVERRLAQLGFGPSFTPEHVGNLNTASHIALLERGVAYSITLGLVAGFVTLILALRLPGERQSSESKPDL